MSNYLIIIIFMIVIMYGYYKKVNLYESFIVGTKTAINTLLNMFSTLVSFMIALSFLFSSGLLEYIEELLDFEYSIIIIQSIIRPLSSNSSLSIMLECYTTYGQDSFISLLSTMIHYVSDASIYIISFYLGIYNIKGFEKILKYGLFINIFSYLLSFCIIYVFYLLIN